MLDWGQYWGCRHLAYVRRRSACAHFFSMLNIVWFCISISLWYSCGFVMFVVRWYAMQLNHQTTSNAKLHKYHKGMKMQHQTTFNIEKVSEPLNHNSLNGIGAWTCRTMCFAERIQSTSNWVVWYKRGMICCGKIMILHAECNKTKYNAMDAMDAVNKA